MRQRQSLLFAALLVLQSSSFLFASSAAATTGDADNAGSDANQQDRHRPAAAAPMMAKTTTTTFIRGGSLSSSKFFDDLVTGADRAISGFAWLADELKRPDVRRDFVRLTDQVWAAASDAADCYRNASLDNVLADKLRRAISTYAGRLAAEMAPTPHQSTGGEEVEENEAAESGPSPPHPPLPSLTALDVASRALAVLRDDRVRDGLNGFLDALAGSVHEALACFARTGHSPLVYEAAIELLMKFARFYRSLVPLVSLLFYF